ncbi:autotransporter family protein [Collimonas humicola]|uniref:autotransporter family protein n=1 Tax=Collimonas humicola TaxID=2825886 RepID=UPI001E40B9C0|nr:autotransporter outer membrane beta-barrel domain-containing protein [Collimonas humicola]
MELYGTAGGGTDIENTTIETGGQQMVYSGSRVTDTVIDGGIQMIDDTVTWMGDPGGGPAVATDTVVNAGGMQDVVSGSAINTTLNGGAQVVRGRGSTANYTTINAGADQVVDTGGTANHAKINSGGMQNVYSGQANNTIVNNGGTQNIYKSGIANDVSVNGGVQNVYDGATSKRTLVNNGGSVNLHGGARASQLNADNGGTVNVMENGVQAIDKLELSNGGSLNFVSDGIFKTLTVNNLVGNNGKMIINTIWGDDSAATDKLIIDGACPGGGSGLVAPHDACSPGGSGHVSGDTGVVVKHAGGDGAQTNIGIRIVETLNGATTNPDAFVLDPASDGYRSGKNTISAGGYDYRLKRGGIGGVADDWYLVSPVVPVDPDKPIEPPPVPVDPVISVISPEVGAYFGNRQAASTMAVHTLHQRQGQAPGMSAEDAAGGIDGAAWAWVEGQDISRKSAGGSLDIEAKQRLIHVGADVLRFKDGGDGSFRVGVMGMYGTATTWSNNDTRLWSGDTLGTARGTVDGYNLGLYGTWYGNHDILSGPYVDTWLTAGRYNNTVGGAGLATEQYRSRTLTASIEGGYSFPIYDQDKTKLYLEPQAQIVYGRYRAGDFTEAGGTTVGGQNGSNLLTRLGVRLHGSSADGPGPDMRPYGELNWWHGSQSAPSMTMDGNVFRDNLPRDRAEVKVGLQGQVTKAIAVSALLGVETDLGSYYAVKGQVGMKYSWK